MNMPRGLEGVKGLPRDAPRKTSNKIPSTENINMIGIIFLAEIFLTIIPRIRTKERSQIIVAGKHSMQLINSSNIIKGRALIR